LLDSSTVAGSHGAGGARDRCPSDITHAEVPIWRAGEVLERVVGSRRSVAGLAARQIR
jgi:hypothetical protein